MNTLMNIDPNAIQYATKLLHEGKLVALPTETVYGLGGDARNEAAIQKIYKIKNRPPTNPLIIHLSTISAIEGFAIDIPEAAYALAQAFWPGPLTLVLKKHPSVLSSITGGQNSVAVRIPNHPVALRLLKEFKGGIAAPSANKYGCLSPTRSQHVRHGLGTEVDYILEGGECQVGIESTIVSLLGSNPVILREGHIKEEDIANVFGYYLSERAQESLPNRSQKGLQKSSQNALHENSGHALPLPESSEHDLHEISHRSPDIVIQQDIEVPGQSAKHYAPSKPLYLLSTSDLKRKLDIQIEREGESESAKNFSCETLKAKTLINEIHDNNILYNEICNNNVRFAVLSFSDDFQSFGRDYFKTHPRLAMEWIPLSNDPVAYASHLYAALHDIDQSEATVILVEAPPAHAPWRAVNDRLKRAATAL